MAILGNPPMSPLLLQGTLCLLCIGPSALLHGCCSWLPLHGCVVPHAGLLYLASAHSLCDCGTGSVEIMDTFWPQMRRVLAADMATLRLDKFKT